MERTLNNLSEKLGFELVCVDISNKNFTDVVKKYDVGSIPKYVFLEETDELWCNVGTEVPYVLERKIKNFKRKRGQ
jgi:hypothetical protein